MILLGLFFIILGLLIKYGKMHSLLAGYNTMSPEKKAKYDIERIASIFRNGMVGMGMVIILGSLAATWFENPDLRPIAVSAAVIIGVPYLLIASNLPKYKVK